MQIVVTAPFTLTLAGDVKRTFEVGVHDVEKDVAEHWYVKAHSTEPKKAKAAAPSSSGAAGGAGGSAGAGATPAAGGDKK